MLAAVMLFTTLKLYVYADIPGVSFEGNRVSAEEEQEIISADNSDTPENADVSENPEYIDTIEDTIEDTETSEYTEVSSNTGGSETPESVMPPEDSSPEDSLDVPLDDPLDDPLDNPLDDPLANPEKSPASGTAETYSPQPASRSDAEREIRVYENLYEEYQRGEVPQQTKPHWEFPVSEEFLPFGYMVKLVEGDAVFERPYYTFFEKTAMASLSLDGLGTKSSPYKIYSGEDLYQIAVQVNNGTDFTGMYFQLQNNIDLKNTDWIPIGTVGNAQELFYNHDDVTNRVSTDRAFRGIFDGNGKAVSNFSVGRYAPATGVAADYKGLFGLVKDAEIKNLTVKDASIYGGSGLGVLAGYITGDAAIENVDIQSSRLTASGGGNYGVGGIAGVIDLAVGNKISVINSSVQNTSVVSTAVYGRAGGMIGSITSYRAARNQNVNSNVLIDNVRVTGGSVSCDNYYVGGLLGEINYYNSGGNKLEVNNAHTNLPVSSGAAGYYIGGLIGFTIIQNTSSGSKIEVGNSSAKGNINTRSYYSGGLIGYIEVTTSAGNIAVSTYTTVKNSFSTGNVISQYNGGANAGGFIGHAHAGDNLPAGTVLIEKCYSTGNVGAQGYNVGGFMGRPTKNVRIRDSYSTGNVESGFDHTGGFIGYSEGNETYGDVLIENCYSTGSVTGKGARTGGFIGWLQASQVKNSYSVGNVTAPGAYMGGFIGIVSYRSAVQNCYSTGLVSGGAAASTGGFIGTTGSERISIQGSFYDTTTSQRTKAIGLAGGQTTAGVSPLSTRKMITQGSFPASWNMKNNQSGAAGKSGTDANPWYIDNNTTYPYLYYQYDGLGGSLTNYHLGSVMYALGGSGEFKPFLQHQADFSFAAASRIQFKVASAGAQGVYFTHTSASNNRYPFGGGTINVPGSGTQAIEGGRLYSIGSISASNIIAFTSFPAAEKTSDRPEYKDGDESTYTYVGDVVTYTVTVGNYSIEYDWKNIVLQDVLPKGVTLAGGSITLDGTPLSKGTVPGYDYNESTREIKVYLADLPKSENGKVNKNVIEFKTDVGTEAASVFPLDPTADNIRNVGTVKGTLYLGGTVIGEHTAPFDDGNTDPVFPKYSVTYNANGGLMQDGGETLFDGFYLPGHIYKVKGNGEIGAQRDGYTFDCWNTSADGIGTSYSQGDTITLDKDTKLYAVWAAVPEFSFYKVDGLSAENGSYDGLEGAEFTLYLWTGGIPAADYPQLQDSSDWKEAVRAVSRADGQVNCGKLKTDSVYLMAETKAPSGYMLPNAQWLIYIDSKGKVTFGDMLSGGDDFAVQSADIDTSTQESETYIPNYILDDGFKMPDAGGRGIMPFILAAALSIVIGTASIFLYRKRFSAAAGK